MTGEGLLVFDPSKDLKCDYNNIEEALAGMACEKQGLLEGLVRDSRGNRGGEFIDKYGQVWDVKTAKSESLSGIKIFEKQKQVNKFFESVKDCLNRKDIRKDVILNMSYLNENDYAKIYHELKKFPREHLERIIIISEKSTGVDVSKTSKELITFLNIG